MKRLFGLTAKARTALALGLANVIRVAWYRASLRIGLNPAQRLRAQRVTGSVFDYLADDCAPAWPNATYSALQYFGWLPMKDLFANPDWHASVISGKRMTNPTRVWWKIPDFHTDVGDIKAVWEPSRWEWVLSLVQQAAIGNANQIDKVNAWLNNWCELNPPYFGPNWKSGQEASIRVIHLIAAAMIGGQAEHPSQNLLDLVEVHLTRIAATLSYAIAQNNNHGTSEAAALFVGGSFLARCNRRLGKDWENLGRYWLEDRVNQLVANDGSFSQYSVNYHRLLLDTLSFVEVWRRYAQLNAFSPIWRTRAAAASEWLRAMVDCESGDAPNVGANDGVRLLPLTNTDYRDFRPSVQLASVLFCLSRAFSQHGPWDEHLLWLGIERPSAVLPPPTSTVFDDGGYAILRQSKTLVVLRYPRFRFRPSHADALHVDLWVAGNNLLRDSGSFSYFEDRWLRYFTGTASHNTVQFDGRDQMPRLGRFLFGDWLRTTKAPTLEIGAERVSCTAGYIDTFGATHERTVVLTSKGLEVNDRVRGFAEIAVLRWRVQPEDWSLDGLEFRSSRFRIAISATMPIVRVEIVAGWESRYYLKKSELPTLEVEVREPGCLTTTISWDP